MGKRKAADPSARLAMLRPVLHELQPGQMVNADEMARMARMTWANLKLIIDRDENFPVASRGGMGIAWEFDAHKAIGYLVSEAEAELARRSESASRIATLAGIAPEQRADQPKPTMTALEIKQTTDALMAQTKLKQMQGELMRRADVADVLMGISSTYQAETLAFLGEYDPAGLLPPEQRKAIEDHQRRLLVRVQDAVMAFLEPARVKHAA